MGLIVGENLIEEIKNAWTRYLWNIAGFARAKNIDTIVLTFKHQKSFHIILTLQCRLFLTSIGSYFAATATAQAYRVGRAGVLDPVQTQ